MRATMILVKCSNLKERSFETSDGGVRCVQFRELTFTDGIDTIFGETGESLTKRIDAQDPNFKIDMAEGHVYNVDFNLSAKTYKNKNGEEGIFFRCLITNCGKLL